jgi:hypothetical protein
VGGWGLFYLREVLVDHLKLAIYFEKGSKGRTNYEIFGRYIEFVFFIQFWCIELARSF